MVCICVGLNISGSLTVNILIWVEWQIRSQSLEHSWWSCLAHSENHDPVRSGSSYSHPSVVPVQTRYVVISANYRHWCIIALAMLKASEAFTSSTNRDEEEESKGNKSSSCWNNAVIVIWSVLHHQHPSEKWTDFFRMEIPLQFIWATHRTSYAIRWKYANLLFSGFLVDMISLRNLSRKRVFCSYLFHS